MWKAGEVFPPPSPSHCFCSFCFSALHWQWGFSYGLCARSLLQRQWPSAIPRLTSYTLIHNKSTNSQGTLTHTNAPTVKWCFERLSGDCSAKAVAPKRPQWCTCTLSDLALQDESLTEKFWNLLCPVENTIQCTKQCENVSPSSASMLVHTPILVWMLIQNPILTSMLIQNHILVRTLNHSLVCVLLQSHSHVSKSHSWLQATLGHIHAKILIQNPILASMLIRFLVSRQYYYYMFFRLHDNPRSHYLQFSNVTSSSLNLVFLLWCGSCRSVWVWCGCCTIWPIRRWALSPSWTSGPGSLCWWMVNWRWQTWMTPVWRRHPAPPPQTACWSFPPGTSPCSAVVGTVRASTRRGMFTTPTGKHSVCQNVSSAFSLFYSEALCKINT